MTSRERQRLKEQVSERRKAQAQACGRPRFRTTPAEPKRRPEPGQCKKCGADLAVPGVGEWKTDPRCLAGGHWRQPCIPCRREEQRADYAAKKARRAAEEGGER